MNNIVTFVMLLYAQRSGLQLSSTERLSFEKIVSSARCPRWLAGRIIRQLLKRHVLEASVGDLPVNEFGLAIIECLNLVIVHDPDCLESLEFLLLKRSRPETRKWHLGLTPAVAPVRA